MNLITRLAIVGGCALLCAAATIVANSGQDCDGEIADWPGTFDLSSLANSYRHVASESARDRTFRQVEAVIRRHASAASHHARMEFGSVEVTGRTAVVQVLFFAPDGEVCPIVYKLAATRKSWKVVAVQRLWFVPRSRLLRGVRA
jgi:hypothetical protein